MLKKPCAFLALAATMAFGQNALAACANLNISSSGGALTSGQQTNVYGPFNVSCLGPQTFTFQDLSGNKPTTVLTHYIEQNVRGSWKIVSSTVSNGASSVNRSFYPSEKGEYRYRIVNTGTTELRNWRMEGRITLFTIPGT